MNILIIGPSWVGDMMMSHSLYQQLKLQYPDCQIDVMAPNWCKPLLARMPEVRHAIEMPLGHGKFALCERYRLGKALRNQYDMAIVLPNSLKSAFIPAFAKIAVRRGWKGESRYFLLNDLRNNKRDYPMMVQRYVALAFEQNAVPKAADIPVLKPYLTVDPTQQAETLKNFEKQTALLGERPIIGFCPGAEFGPAKRWPHYHYAKLAEMLIEKGYAVELFGSPKDVEAGEQIRNALPVELQPFCLNLAGQTNLNQAVDLIANCTAVVSNDSGLMHIAAATDRPLVALYGPTSPTYTPPLSDKAVIIRLIEGDLIKVRKSTDSSEGYHQSLIDITPEKVVEKLTALFMRNWAEVLYDYYENILAYYAGYILFAISMFSFFYAVLLRPYLNTKAFQSQVFEGANKSTTVQIQENGLCTKIDFCQVLHNYRNIHHIENHYGYLTIRIGSGQFLSIPHSAFQDDAHREAFEAALREKIKAYQAEPLSK